MTNKLTDQINTQIEILRQIYLDQSLHNTISGVVHALLEAISEAKPILVCGNGGSASDALHISGELIGRFLKERKPLNVVCLNSNVAAMTAWANDYNYDTVFSRQVEAHGEPGGVLWALSTSGNSKNIIQAMQAAKMLDMKVVAMTGSSGGNARPFSDLLITVPSESTPRIQEAHLPIYHYICEQVEANI